MFDVFLLTTHLIIPNNLATVYQQTQENPPSPNQETATLMPTIEATEAISQRLRRTSLIPFNALKPTSSIANRNFTSLFQ